MEILIIGSGPNRDWAACGVDYSGAQACKALHAEGYEVVLVNSNPATIMTDPELAHRTYIEPLTKEYLEQIIAKEKPDALLPTVGGQTALNLAVELAESGILEKYKVEMIGASLRAIKVAEDRLWFKDACRKIGLEVPASALVNNAQDALRLCDQLGFPLVIRPSFTLGGSGGSIAYNKEEFAEAIAHALDMSPVHEALVEESVLGWKEYELEVMRDYRDNFVVICTIENFDPMGVHTGDSITVAPAQTLTDKEYRQRMRRRSRIAIIREKWAWKPAAPTCAVCRQSRKRPNDRDRNESTRFAQFGAGQQGYRLPNREDCRTACCRHDPGRNSQRHHEDDAGVFRADHRLCRGENSQVAIREVSRSRQHPGHPDEVRGRSDGHWPHLQGITAEREFARWSPALPGALNYRCARFTATREAGPRLAPIASTGF